MRETEVEMIVGELDFKSLAVELAGEFGLPLLEQSDGRTTDHYLDTKSRLLLSRGASLRLREKLYKGRASEFRLTIKFPIEEHEILLIRDEIRLRLLGADWKNVIEFSAEFAYALSGEPVVSQFILDEYYQQASLGGPERHLDISYDNVAFISPSDYGKHAQEYVLEFEDHGIGEDTVLAAYEYMRKKHGLKADRRGKYRRGLEVLGI